MYNLSERNTYRPSNCDIWLMESGIKTYVEARYIHVRWVDVYSFCIFCSIATHINSSSTLAKH